MFLGVLEGKKKKSSLGLKGPSWSPLSLSCPTPTSRSLPPLPQLHWQPLFHVQGLCTFSLQECPPLDVHVADTFLFQGRPPPGGLPGHLFSKSFPLSLCHISLLSWSLWLLAASKTFSLICFFALLVCLRPSDWLKPRAHE